MRIGVFGGSFDPVHVGHLAAARQVADRLALDQVRFVPAGLQPLKGTHHAPGEARVAMLAAAIGADARFLIDRRELDRSGPSYMVDTLRELRATNPGDQLFLMLGADAAQELPRWREPDAVATLARIVVHSRTGRAIPRLAWPLEVVNIDAPEVSASAVRDAVAHGASLSGVVPDVVATYIRTHGLYRKTDAC